MLIDEEISIGKIFSSNELPTDLIQLLELIRMPLVRLSETKFPKPLFNQWKLSGIIEPILTRTDKKQWNIFSLMDYVILDVVNILWHKNIDEDKIKLAVTKMLGEGIKIIEAINLPKLTGSSEDINYISYIDKQESILHNDDEKVSGLINQVLKLSSNLDLMVYLRQQKKINPTLPNISWIENFIVGSLKTEGTFSLLLFETGEIHFQFIDNFFIPNNKQLFRSSFINISINDIVSGILSKDIVSSKGIFDEETNIIKRLMEKGYDWQTLKQLFEKDTPLKYTEEILPVKETRIEKAINQYSNQDILIKIRDSKKNSIRRIIIEK